MKNAVKVALLATAVAASGTAFAGQPVGAAMVSTKLSHQVATTSTQGAGAEVATKQAKAFQWGSTAARTNTAPERNVKTNSPDATPSSIN